MKPARQPEASPQSTRMDDQDLELLGEILESEGAFSEALSERIRAGFLAYAVGTEGRSLEQCLGFTARPGKRSIGRRLAYARRCAALLDAWNSMVGCEGLGEWKRYEVFIEEMKDFSLNYLGTWERDGVPAGASRLRQSLYVGFTAMDSPPPWTAAGLHALLNKASSGSSF